MANFGKDLIALADQLFHPATCDEAMIRTLINRWYYGAFIIARNHAGMDQVTKNVHKKVIASFANDAIAHHALSNLRSQRVVADYQLKKTLSIRDAIRAQSIARQALTHFRSLGAPEAI